MTFFSLYKSKTYFRDNVNWVWWLKLSGQSIVVNSLDNIQNHSVSKASLTKLPVSFKCQIDIWVRCIKIFIFWIFNTYSGFHGKISFYGLYIKEALIASTFALCVEFPKYDFKWQSSQYSTFYSKCQQGISLPSRYFLQIPFGL